MARKSNKTSHVLHLLAGEEPVPETPENKKETEETKEPADAAEKESSAERSPTPLESFGQAVPEEEMPNISIISTGNSEDDPVADLIRGQLEEDFPEDILPPQPAPETTDDPADSGAPGTVETATDSHTSDITDTSAGSNTPDTAAMAADSNGPDTADIDGPNTVATTADSNVSDETDTPADNNKPGTVATAADSSTPDTADTLADSSGDGAATMAGDSVPSDTADTPADSNGPAITTTAEDSSASDTADIPTDKDSSASAPTPASPEPPAQETEKTSDVPADSNAGGSGTVGQTEQPEPGPQATETPTATAKTETEGSTSVQPDSIPPDDTAVAVNSANPAAVTATAGSPDRPPLTREHLDSVLYPVDGDHLQNYRFVNVMEYIVKDIAIDYMKKFDMCTCERCVVDTIALTLTYCSAKYIVVDSHSVSPLLNFYSNRYLGDVTVELTKACIKIKENPRH